MGKEESPFEKIINIVGTIALALFVLKVVESCNRSSRGTDTRYTPEEQEVLERAAQEQYDDQPTHLGKADRM